MAVCREDSNDEFYSALDKTLKICRNSELNILEDSNAQVETNRMMMIQIRIMGT